MLQKLVKFVKYNNLATIVIVGFLLVATSALAQSQAIGEAIGEKVVVVEGIDNTLLLEADLDTFAMDFTIERIEKDERYFHVVYTYLDLAKQDNVWKYQVNEKTIRVPLSLRVDLGDYLAEEFNELYEARIKELKKFQQEANREGVSTRVEVTEYNGLIGQTLSLGSRVFTGYEPAQKRAIPSPSIPNDVLMARQNTEIGEVSVSDNLTDVYAEYINENDPDKDNVFDALDNCPNVYNPDQVDSDDNGIGDDCEENEIINTVDEISSSTEDIIEPSEDDPATSTDVEQDAPEEEQINTQIQTNPADSDSEENVQVEIINLEQF